MTFQDYSCSSLLSQFQFLNDARKYLKYGLIYTANANYTLSTTQKNAALLVTQKRRFREAKAKCLTHLGLAFFNFRFIEREASDKSSLKATVDIKTNQNRLVSSRAQCTLGTENKNHMRPRTWRLPPFCLMNDSVKSLKTRANISSL